MSLTQSNEAQRNLLTGMEYRRGDALVTQRSYTYDALGRPLTRDTQYPGKGITHNDSFTHNSRSELVHAQLDDTMHGYAYDNIGNRKNAQEAAEEATAYTANALNQYTAIQQGSKETSSVFTPTYDADGNQTIVKTNTGIWSIVYNAENRPITFTNNESNTVIECAYDYMGRRTTKKVTINNSVTLNQRYIYRGYLQIACCDLTRSAHPCLWLITWDPTQPVATRPLAIQKSGTWYCYGWDLTNNICEVYGQTGYIRTLYSYTPYGKVSRDGDVNQDILWNAEFNDNETELIYYNFRYYNPYDGRWLNRDFYTIKEDCLYVNNKPIMDYDMLGLICLSNNSDYLSDCSHTIGINYAAELGTDDPLKVSNIWKEYKWSFGRLYNDSDTSLLQCFRGQYGSLSQFGRDIGVVMKTMAWVRVSSLISSKTNLPNDEIKNSLATLFSLRFEKPNGNVIGGLNFGVELFAAYPVSGHRGAKLNWEIVKVTTDPLISNVEISSSDPKIKDGKFDYAQYGGGMRISYTKILSKNTELTVSGETTIRGPIYNEHSHQCEYTASVGFKYTF